MSEKEDVPEIKICSDCFCCNYSTVDVCCYCAGTIFYSMEDDEDEGESE